MFSLIIRLLALRPRGLFLFLMLFLWEKQLEKEAKKYFRTALRHRDII